jgi:hypothetical protein
MNAPVWPASTAMVLGPGNLLSQAAGGARFFDRVRTNAGAY